MTAKEFDAIVVGASFAGLAVARQLRGEVLVLDRNEVGAVQTSACGTPLWVPESLGLAESILQVHDRLTVRTPLGSVTYDLSEVPFCTFDYKAFCLGLLAQCRARFMRASVTGFEEGAVVTSEGRFRAPIIVDASGWRGALVNSRGRAPIGRGYSFGLEPRARLIASLQKQRRAPPQPLPCRHRPPPSPAAAALSSRLRLPPARRRRPAPTRWRRAG